MSSFLKFRLKEFLHCFLSLFVHMFNLSLLTFNYSSLHFTYSNWSVVNYVTWLGKTTEKGLERNKIDKWSNSKSNRASCFLKYKIKGCSSAVYSQLDPFQFLLFRDITQYPGKNLKCNTIFNIQRANFCS